MRPRTGFPSSWAVTGCVALALATAVALVTFLFVGERMARSVRRQMDDPALRTAKAQRLLRTRDLPEGYAATLAVDVPLLGSVTVLEGPQRPLADGREVAPDRMFLYLERRGSEAGDTWLEDLDRLLRVRGLEIELGPVLAEGRADTLAYRAMRARLRQHPRGEWPVLAALVDVRCSEREPVVRFGVWIERDPAVGWDSEEVDFSGTPADPEAIRSFMGQFGFCSGGRGD